MKTLEDAVRECGGVPPSVHTESGWWRWSSERNCRVVTDDGYIVGTLDEFIALAAKLRNEPRFEDHPDAKCFVCCPSGIWYKHTGTANVTATDDHGGRWTSPHRGDGEFRAIHQGVVLGDWKNTLVVRPSTPKVIPYGEIAKLELEISELTKRLVAIKTEHGLETYCCRRSISSRGWHHDEDCKNWVLTY